jgi:hypothetical protein
MAAAGTTVVTRPVVTSYTWPETVIVSGRTVAERRSSHVILLFYRRQRWPH